MAKRLDSRLEAEGAEFLVLGHLLVEGIEATKAYRNFPGFDLYAADPTSGQMCRVQVKSRWATDYDGGFPIRNFDSDFVVFVELNRGFRTKRRRASADDGKNVPRFFVFPTEVVRAAQNPKSTWGKVFLRHMDRPEQYLDDWHSIRVFLESGSGDIGTPS